MDELRRDTQRVLSALTAAFGGVDDATGTSKLDAVYHRDAVFDEFVDLRDEYELRREHDQKAP